MGLTVADDDLREVIMQIPDFQKNGTFDPEVYQRLLAANHLTPAIFEAMEAKEVLSNKARMIIRDAVALTPAELAEAQALTLRQTESDPAKAAAAKDRAIQDVLFQKQQRALMAYTESLKTTIPIKINRELLVARSSRHNANSPDPLPLYSFVARESTSHHHSYKSGTAREPPLHKPVEEIRSRPMRRPASAMWYVASENS